MPNIPAPIREKLMSIGVKSINDPSAHDIKLILDAFLRSKELDVESFNVYVNCISPTLKVVFEGLQQFAKSSENITEKTLSIINTAISILGAELSKDLTEQARSEIRTKIVALVNEARKESESHRNLIRTLSLIGGAVALVLIGGAVVVLTRGKNTAVLAKGVEMAGKVIKAV